MFQIFLRLKISENIYMQKKKFQSSYFLIFHIILEGQEEIENVVLPLNAIISSKDGSHCTRGKNKEEERIES